MVNQKIEVVTNEEIRAKDQFWNELIQLEHQVEKERINECLHGGQDHELEEDDEILEDLRHADQELHERLQPEEHLREDQLHGGEPEQGDRDLPLAARFPLPKLLQRAHEGLGHPSTERFVRVLRYAKAKPEIIEAARSLRCSVCQRHQQSRPTRRSAPPRELDFNECLGIDVVYLPIPGGKSRPALNMIDWGTKFQLIVPLTSKKPEECREAYRQWLRIFGAPKRMAIDLGKEFKGIFAQQAEQDGSYVDPAAVEAPHQRGITARRGKTFKFILMKAMDSYSCETMKEWEDQ